jgi:hypothetical protein
MPSSFPEEHVEKDENLFHERNEEVTIPVENNTGTWYRYVVTRKNKDRYKAALPQTDDKDLTIRIWYRYGRICEREK